MGSCTSTPPEHDRQYLPDLLPLDTQQKMSIGIDDFDDTPHPLQTIDDNTLMSNIRDIIEDDERSNSENTIKQSTYQLLYEDLVFNKLNLKDYNPLSASVNNLKQRILYILSEIRRQDLGDSQFDSVEAKTQHDYHNNFDLGYVPITNLDENQLDHAQQLKDSKAYIKIMKKHQPQLDALLRDKNKFYKTKDRLLEECIEGIDECNDIERCQPLKRLEVMLAVYKQLMNEKPLWRRAPMSDILTVKDVYGLQQLSNDWLHVKIVHIDSDTNKDGLDSIARRLCIRYAENPEWSCHDLQNCVGYQRHYRNRTFDESEQQLYFRRNIQPKATKAKQIMNDKDVVYQQECDKIHAFLLHSTIKWGTGIDALAKTISSEARTMNIIKHSKGRSYSLQNKELIPVAPPSNLDSTALDAMVLEEDTEDGDTDDDQSAAGLYVGSTEDKRWWRNIDDIDIDIGKKGITTPINQGYGKLMSKMGVFRYQSAHGFRFKQNGCLTHLKPKFKDLKEEVLHNKYHKLSVLTWNQTLRKSKMFFQSFARRKCRTRYDGEYEDQITGERITWTAGEEIVWQEIITFKLYTDFDQLQSNLKRCFRLNSTFDLLKREEERRRLDIRRTWSGGADAADDEAKQFARAQHAKLEERLTQFFHWRLKLATVLNKFSTKIGHGGRNVALYHGVNQKMTINPSEAMAFHGPLSTTESYHVARVFATNKGMVLKLTTNFPRLGFCKAFDVSSISDYPEEQEWLVGFIYMRVLEVRTHQLSECNADGFSDYHRNDAWNAPMVRSIFFAINLFREQMYSMSTNLECHLQAFLQQICPIPCDAYDDQLRQNAAFLKSVIENKPHAKQNRNTQRKRKILKILWEKFDEFRKLPNLKQSIKFDIISDGLKPYFLDESKEKDIHKKRIIWDVSFDKITKLFPNAKSIHFKNEYRFNEVTLDRLIRQIQKPDNKLKCIKFLYFNYKNKPTDSKNFYDPNRLSKIKLDKLAKGIKTSDHRIKRWKCVTRQNKINFKIRLFEDDSVPDLISDDDDDDDDDDDVLSITSEISRLTRRQSIESRTRH